MKSNPSTHPLTDLPNTLTRKNGELYEVLPNGITRQLSHVSNAI